MSERHTLKRVSNDDFRITLVQVLLLALLILVVAGVLVALIYLTAPSWWAAIAVVIVLTVLMLVVIGAPDLLPRILHEIGRILGLRR
jgi:membrane protein YdbS with pleckstrin-like domain